MKMTAVIEVEFELIDGQPENAARAALQRGLSGLRESIEFGSRVGPTGVRRGSVKVDTVSQTNRMKLCRGLMTLGNAAAARVRR